MHIFIDTNIFLSFFGFSQDVLEELNKLSVLLKQHQNKIYIPTQIKHEYRRNRERVIHEAIKKLEQQKLELEFPALCRDYEDFRELREYQSKYSELRSKIIDAIYEDIRNENLKADKIIKEIFSSTTALKCDEKILSYADIRMRRGDPPGKDNSLGDAINWECLLENVPDGQDLYFITDDHDYISPISQHKIRSFNKFLLQEWESKKKSNIIYYPSLSFFFKEHYPHIKLAEELEKQFAISRFVHSSSFVSTHNLISQLNNFNSFNKQQVNEIIDAYISNDQIHRIINDEDVNIFLKKICGMHNDIDESSLEYLEYLENKYQPIDPFSYEDNDDDLPF